MKKPFAPIIACLAFALLAGTANAALLTFTASQMDAMTVQAVFVNNTSVPLTRYQSASPNPADPTFDVTLPPFTDAGIEVMTGAAGATGAWTGLGVMSADVLFGLNSAGVLAQFGTNNFSLGGFTALAVQGFNDNNSIWGYDIWIETTANGRVTSVPVNIIPGGSAPVTLDLTGLNLSNVTGIGLSIHGVFSGGPNPSGGDRFHASWSPLPEPVSVAVWSTFCAAAAGVGLVRRRRK
ncbi:MAG TPA: hypothetical protein VFB96_08765 [Pirellulaceae bacterium]|nr:hypothetical protein [Pirellulaceae bacterium]